MGSVYHGCLPHEPREPGGAARPQRRAPALDVDRSGSSGRGADAVSSAGAPSASVVICAYTEARWDTLVASAEAARAQRPAPLEVVIVADHAPALLDRVRLELTWAVAVQNDAETGLSGARNAGVAAARGEVVVFLDDDAIPEPGWLSHLLAPYADPGVLGVGGAAVPAFAAGRPPFLAPEFDWVVGCTYRGLPDRLAPVRNFIGANMSLRREALAIAGGFHAGLGRVGTAPAGCEETELCIRLRRLRPDAELLYEPRARVRHLVTLERARPRYFVSRCWSEGVSKALVTRHAGAAQGLASERAHAMRTLPRGVARELGELLSLRDAAGALRAAGIVAGLAITAAGYVREALRPRSPGPSSAGLPVG